MKEKKNIVKNKLWTPRQIEMVEMLQAEHGVNSFSTVIDMAVADMFSRTYPAYRQSGLASRGATDEKTIETKAKFKVAQKKAEKELAEKSQTDEKARICTDILFGEVSDGDHGKVCRFTTYYANGKNAPQQVPLQQAHTILADTSLFIPSRKVVLEKRPELLEELSLN